jgi:hypothetical protein
LDLVVVVLDVRAKDALENMKAEMQKTRRRSRNVIGVTTNLLPGKSLLHCGSRFAASESAEFEPKNHLSSYLSMVSDVFHRAQR